MERPGLIAAQPASPSNRAGRTCPPLQSSDRPRTVGPASPLRHDALEAHGACGLKHGRPVAVQMLRQSDAVAGLGQRPHQGSPAGRPSGSARRSQLRRGRGSSAIAPGSDTAKASRYLNPRRTSCERLSSRHYNRSMQGCDAVGSNAPMTPSKIRATPLPKQRSQRCG